MCSLDFICISGWGTIFEKDVFMSGFPDYFTRSYKRLRDTVTVLCSTIYPFPLVGIKKERVPVVSNDITRTEQRWGRERDRQIGGGERVHVGVRSYVRPCICVHSGRMY